VQPPTIHLSTSRRRYTPERFVRKNGCWWPTFPQHEFSSRQKHLAGKTYGTGSYEGETYDRWQYEETAGGRIFYFVDDPTGGGRTKPQRRGRGVKPRGRLIIEAVHPGHPKGTERKRG
jgi:hypothetical protein